jgi:hypothetical protein
VRETEATALECNEAQALEYLVRNELAYCTSADFHGIIVYRMYINSKTAVKDQIFREFERNWMIEAPAREG